MKKIVKRYEEISKKIDELEEEKYELGKNTIVRIDEMRAKYRVELDKLRLKYNDKCAFFEYSGDGYREIKMINCFENFFIASVNDHFRDQDPNREHVTIPYDSVDDDDFIKKFVEKQESKYLAEIEKKRSDKEAVELAEFERLKKKFEIEV